MDEISGAPSLLKMCGISMESRYLEKVVDFNYSVNDDLGGTASIDLRDVSCISVNKQRKGNLWVLNFGPRSKANNSICMYYKSEMATELVRSTMSAEKKRQIEHDEAAYANLSIPVEPVQAIPATLAEENHDPRFDGESHPRGNGYWRVLLRRLFGRVRERTHNERVD
ncbi:hypothetical protein [Erwinia phage vB_Ea277G]|jgi:hypothetical protein|nr:hypothetical protein [Erwinia phage vB_Ea277G]